MSFQVDKDVMVASVDSGVKAIAPAVMTTDYYTTPWYSEGGALSLQAIQSWTTLMAMADAQRAVAAGNGDQQAFPRFDRNTNTGGVISEDSESDTQTTVNRVVHGPEQPSRLVLPVTLIVGPDKSAQAIRARQ